MHSSRILLTGNMANLYVFACFFSLLTILHAAGPTKSGCLEREKALTLLETAENLLSKAADSYPTCREELNSTGQSECGEKKPLAYIEVSKKLISDVRKNFPTCLNVSVKQVKPNDCSEILASGLSESGVYTIWLRESRTTGKSLQVYCDMKTDGGGWTVIQRRGPFPVQRDFYLDWESYKNGFGNITEEFWLGNENIRVLCHKGCEIRFDLQDRVGEKGFAVYRNFKLSGSNYTLNISGYEGDAGDSMVYHNNMDFSTKDKGKTEIVEKRHGGMWYSGNNYCNLNGLYQPSKDNTQTVHWYTWRKFINLARAEIKVKPK